MNDVEKYEAIEALFDKHLRPALMSDGGNIEYSIPTPEVMADAFDMEKKNYGFVEEISDRAKDYLREQGEKIK